MVATTRPSHEEFAKSVKKYIDSLKAMDPEKARQISRETLIKTGVLDENGNTKETIVTGDFFGW